jgi:ribosomal protein L33
MSHVQQLIIFLQINTRPSSSSTSLIANGLSDHGAQSLSINNTVVATHTIPSKQRTRKINNERTRQFQLQLRNETLESVYRSNDTDSKFNSFLYTFLNNFDACFPIKYKSIGKIKNDWTIQGIKISCKCKRSLYIYSRNSNDSETKVFYHKYCKIPNKVIKEAKKH